MPALTKTSSSRPTPPWRPHNRNSPPQQGKGGNAAAAMTPACPKPTKNQSYAEPVQLSRPEYPSQSPTHHADTQISPITLKSSASKTPREKSGNDFQGWRCRGLPERFAAAGSRRRSGRTGIPHGPHHTPAVRPEPDRSRAEAGGCVEDAAGRLIACGSRSARRKSGGAASVDGATGRSPRAGGAAALPASGPDRRTIPFQEPFNPHGDPLSGLMH